MGEGEGVTFLIQEYESCTCIYKNIFILLLFTEMQENLMTLKRLLAFIGTHLPAHEESSKTKAGEEKELAKYNIR